MVSIRDLLIHSEYDFGKKRFSIIANFMRTLHGLANLR